MKIIIGNVKCDVVIGGKDFLLGIDIIKEMRAYLRVKADGAYFSPAYKKGRWDGYQYFCTPKGSFATGFLPQVCNFLNDLGVPLDIEDKRTNLPEFINPLNPDIKVWELRDYQFDALKKGENYIEIQGQTIYFPRGIYKAATNAGKNSLIAALHLNLKNSRTLMLIHNSEIYKQAVAFFSDIMEVGRIDSKTYDLKGFNIAMYKSLFNKAKKSVNVKKDLAEITTLIVDETHRASSSEYAQLMTMIPAGARFLVSGTPLGSKKKSSNLVIIGMSGPVLFNLENEFLMDNNYSARPIIKVYENKIEDWHKSVDYKDEVSNVIKFSNIRLNVLSDYCSEFPDKQILISVEHKDHAEFILEGLLKDFDKVEFVHGSDKSRASKIDSFKAGEVRILIATMILKEGVNIPNIDTLFLMHGGKSIITLKQLIGRVIRKQEEGEEFVDVIDFYDHGKWTAKQSRDRIRIYKKEKFEIQYMYEANGHGFPKK